MEKKTPKVATIKELKKVMMFYLLRIALLPFRLLNIKKNRIMFVSLTGGKYIEYTCNPKYVYEALRDDSLEGYEIVWAFSNPEKYLFLQEQGVQVVKHFSLKAMCYLMTSKVVVTGGSYLPWVKFRKEQVIIDTWHGGGAYKRLDRAEGLRSRLTDKQNKLAGSHATVFVTSSNKFTEYVIQDTFGFQGEILEIGMPRNDFLVKNQVADANQKVRNHYQIDDTIGICLYAPTYRELGQYEKLDMQKVRAQLQKTTGKQWVCLVRGHRYEADAVGKAGEGIIDVSDYPEMQELLAASDVLISDYSSCIWDYSFLERPVFLYVSDLKEYRENCGFYVDITQWHMPCAENEEEMMKQLARMQEIDWHKEMLSHRKELGSCETGHAAQSIATYIKARCPKE